MLTTSESREEITVVRLSPQALKESLRKTLKAKTNVSTKIMIFKTRRKRVTKVTLRPRVIYVFDRFSIVNKQQHILNSS